MKMKGNAQSMYAQAKPTPPPTKKNLRRAEGGYALVGLIALMTIMAMAVASAAPSLRLQAQREREHEAITRGEEVAEALERWVRLMGPQNLPRSMEQLLEGANPPGRTQKIYVLRAYAARDPLSSSGEWLLIQPGNRKLVEFQLALQKYFGGRQLPPSQEQWKNPFRPQPTALTVIGREGDDGRGGEDDSIGGDVPFIGVASRSRRDSVVHYFGIDNPNGWVFTPIYR